MQVTINGETKNLEKSLTVQMLLESLQLDVRKVAIERNLEIIPKSTYAEVTVNEGDRLEIVQFMGGG